MTGAGGAAGAADRRRAVDVERDLARARWSQPLPDGEDLARVWTPRDPAALRARLEGRDLVLWQEDDVLHVLWAGTADAVGLGGGVQPELWPVPGTDDLWEASMRVRDLDRVALSAYAFPDVAGRTSLPVLPVVWTGPAAEAVATQPLLPTARVESVEVGSRYLTAPRQVDLWAAPGAVPESPVVLLADGHATSAAAAMVELAAGAGGLAPVRLVGLHPCLEPPSARGDDGRAREYVPGADRRRFGRHLSFAVEEALPLAGADDRAPVLTAGFSNGAAWAIAAGLRRPDVVRGVVALSPGVLPGRLLRAAHRPTWVGAGRLEPGFREAAAGWAERLRRAGVPVEHVEWDGGHDDLWWRHHLPGALAWVLGRL